LRRKLLQKDLKKIEKQAIRGRAIQTQGTANTGPEKITCLACFGNKQGGQ
jgi:hypothetical protein